MQRHTQFMMEHRGFLIMNIVCFNIVLYRLCLIWQKLCLCKGLLTTQQFSLFNIFCILQRKKKPGINKTLCNENIYMISLNGS